MADRRVQLTRIGISLMVSVVIAFLARMSMQPGAPNPQEMTRIYLEYEADLIQMHHDKTGVLPTSLTDLEPIPHYEVVGGVPADAWRHPLVYSTDGRTYTLLSYGRDGKPGGIGLDCDLSVANPKPEESYPTWRQILVDMTTTRILWWCAISGTLGFVLCMVLFWRIDLSRRGILALMLKVLIVLIAAAFIATWMTVLHIPSGH